MKLCDLLSPIPDLASDIPNMEIQTITENSRLCDANTLFVCIEGHRSDGHRYASDAYKRGCRTFLAQKELELPSDAITFKTPDTRHALALLACRFYGDPSHRLSVIGVTGTKGKTTVACMIRKILEDNGISCGYIGTNGVDFCGRHEEIGNTTPDAITLQRTFDKMVNVGCKAVVLEVSSQALLQHRVDGTRFLCGVYTNLYSDHIGDGEHCDFENYKACKHRLFTDFEMKSVICNTDDPYAPDMVNGCCAEIFTCAANHAANFRCTQIEHKRSSQALGMTFNILYQNQSVSFSIPMIGIGNVLNATQAATVAHACFEISLENAAQALQTVQVSGRSDVIPLRSGSLAVIDYAHNGESLRHILTELRKFCPSRIICLFGSVGERTTLRRYELGCAAGELSDLCILTSDNPATEDPQKIINEIVEVVIPYGTPYLSIVDREEAIRYAVKILKHGDILLLAGKGHEEYQLIGTEKIPFSDKSCLLSALEAHEKESIVL